MKEPSRAGGKPAKARSSKASKLKRNIVPKAAEHRSSAMQQIAGWLDNLGMSEYAERFSENKIALRHRPGVMRTIEEVNKAMLAADYEGYSHAR